MAFIPSDLPNIAFWCEPSIGPAYQHFDHTGGTPVDGGEVGIVQSIVNQGEAAGQYDFVESDESNHHRPLWVDPAINGFASIKGPVQNDNTHNSVIHTTPNAGWGSTPDLTLYFVAKSTNDFTSDNHERILFSTGVQGGTRDAVILTIQDKKWSWDTEIVHREFGTHDNNWHIFTLKITSGLTVFGGGIRLYLDTAELTGGTDIGTDGMLSLHNDKLILFNYSEGAGWDTMWYGECAAWIGYTAAHDDTDRAKVEQYLNCRFFNTDCPSPGGGTILRPGLGLNGLGSGGPFFSNPLE